MPFFEARGITLTTNSESPAGAGIAGSSALMSRLRRTVRVKRTPYDPEGLLQVAMNGRSAGDQWPTGLQDYRPALYGGIAAVELEADGVKRVPLDVDLAAATANRSLLHREPRNSGTNNWEITSGTSTATRFIFDCFERIRDTAGPTALRRLRAATGTGRSARLPATGRTASSSLLA